MTKIKQVAQAIMLDEDNIPAAEYHLHAERLDLIWAATEHDGDCTNQAHTCLVCCVEEYESKARAAISSMREPTEEMERAYFDAPMPKFKTKASSSKRYENNRKKMQSRWRAMISAALGEEYRETYYAVPATSDVIASQEEK